MVLVCIKSLNFFLNLELPCHREFRVIQKVQSMLITKARLRNSQHGGEMQKYGSSSDEWYGKKGSSSSPTLIRTHGRANSKISPIHQREAIVRKTDLDCRG
ncbi:hypothetical protein V6N13_045400 [Hibiscus sabdariffa]